MQVALHPSDPDVMVLRYQYGGEGLFYTNDGGERWRMLCGSAIDPGLRRGGQSAIAGDGTVVMGVFEGMWQDDGAGCGWSKVAAAEGTWVSDITQHPVESGILLAATAASGAGIVNGILRRDADGTWTEVGTREELLITRLRAVATADGVRFYESVINGQKPVTIDGMEAMVPNYIVRSSDDEGQTWAEFPANVEAAAGVGFRLLAVDPTQPDRIIGVINRAELQDTIMVSEDRGENFSNYIEIGEIGGIALAPDGRVWIADAGSASSPGVNGGIWHAATLDETPAKMTDDFPVNCLAYQPTNDVLYACQRVTFGRVDLSNGTFEASFVPQELAEFVTCEGMDMAAICETQLCSAYCGLGHFAQAPMCCAYDGEYCGPRVTQMEGAVTACASGAGGVGGTAMDGGVGSGGGTAEAGSTAGTGQQAGDGVAGAAGVGNSSVSSDAGGGCSCYITTFEGGRTQTLAALIAVGVALFMRRRRGP